MKCSLVVYSLFDTRKDTLTSNEWREQRRGWSYWRRKIITFSHQKQKEQNTFCPVNKKTSILCELYSTYGWSFKTEGLRWLLEFGVLSSCFVSVTYFVLVFLCVSLVYALNVYDLLAFVCHYLECSVEQNQEKKENDSSNGESSIITVLNTTVVHPTTSLSLPSLLSPDVAGLGCILNLSHRTLTAAACTIIAAFLTEHFVKSHTAQKMMLTTEAHAKSLASSSSSYSAFPFTSVPSFPIPTHTSTSLLPPGFVPPILKLDIRACGLSSVCSSILLSSLIHTHSTITQLDFSSIVGHSPNRIGTQTKQKREDASRVRRHLLEFKRFVYRKRDAVDIKYTWI